MSAGLATTVLLSLGFALCLTPQARAQGAAAGQALFTQARESMDDKDYDTACAKFRESDRVDPAVGTRFNLALCEKLRGNVATAWVLYSGVADELPADDSRRDISLKEVAQLARRIPKVRLKLAVGAPQSTRMSIGEAQFGAAAFGSEIPLDPGEHVVIVTADGHEERRSSLRLAEGERLDVLVEPGPRAAERVTPNEPEFTQAHTSAGAPDDVPQAGGDTKPLGFVLGAVGVAGLVTGAVAGIMAKGQESDNQDNCSDGLKLCNEDGREAGEAAETLALVSTVGWVVGGLGVGAGLYFILTSDDGQTQTTIGATGGYQGAQVSVSGRW